MLNKVKRLIQHVTIIKFCFLLLLLPHTAMGDVLILLSKNTNTYQQVAEAVKKQVDQPSKIAYVDNFDKEDANGFKNIVTIGASATHFAYEYLPLKTRIFAGLLPRKTFKEIVATYPEIPRLKNSTATAIYLDQPLERQIILAKALLPEAKTLGTALGPNSQSDLEKLQKTAEKYKLELKYSILDSADNPLNKLQPIISQSDIFLALPDSSVFTRTSAKWILFISLRKSVPLIGFSKKYVSAGALAAVHSSPQQIGIQLGETVNQSTYKNKLPMPQDPKYFEVTTNSHAAEVLKIELPDHETLKELLKGRAK